MEHVKAWGKNVWKYSRKHWFIFFAVVTYLLFAAYYMGPSVTSCTDVVYGFGDNTAGPIWRGTLPEQSLLGGKSDVTNYPYGDNLDSPIAYSLILQTMLIKAFQAVAGPICGYNIVSILGFVLSALVMFGFIRSLTKNKWVAWFAGYAVAFSPYYQMKVGVHANYGYQAIFIGLIWLFYRLLQHRRMKDAVYLALLFCVAIYFDPYFTLLAAVTLLALGLAWLLYHHRVFTRAFWRHKNKDLAVKSQLKTLILSAAFMLIAALPLLGVYITEGKQINADVAASRGNVLAEAKACSNWPHEYFVPFVLHPLFESIFGKDQYIKVVDYLRGGHSCGIGEDTIGLSISLSLLVLFCGVGLTWDKLRGRRTGMSGAINYKPLGILLLGVGLVGLFAVAFALPPVRLKGIIPTPSYVLLLITSTWRTLTRFYMLVNIALVVTSALFLTYISDVFKKYRRTLIVLFIVLFGAVFIEYQIFIPFRGNTLSTFSYTNDAPAAYKWLKEQKDIKVVAEYPLEQYGKESDAMSYYLTMQTIHKKTLFNSALSYSPQEPLKDSLKNLNDPQTIPVLASMGVDTVIAHGVSADILKNIPGVVVLHTAPQAKFTLLSNTPTIKSDNIVILDITHAAKRDYYLDLGEGFVRNTTIIKSVVDWKYEALSGARINIEGITDHHFVEYSQEAKVCFSAQMSVPEEVTVLSAKVGGHTVELGPITGKLASYTLSASQSIELIAGNGHNMRVTNLGCS